MPHHLMRTSALYHAVVGGVLAAITVLFGVPTGAPPAGAAGDRAPLLVRVRTPLPPAVRVNTPPGEARNTARPGAVPAGDLRLSGTRGGASLAAAAPLVVERSGAQHPAPEAPPAAVPQPVVTGAAGAAACGDVLATATATGAPEGRAPPAGTPPAAATVPATLADPVAVPLPAHAVPDAGPVPRHCAPPPRPA